MATPKQTGHSWNKFGNSTTPKKGKPTVTTKIEKLSIEAAETGILIDVDGAPEGINIEYEILPTVIAALTKEALNYHTAAQSN